MARKTYKNKGIPVKGSEMRLIRSVRLSDSAWAALDEVAKLTNRSRADLVEWWVQVLTNGKEQFEVIAKNEGCTVEELINRVLSQIPDALMQYRANKPLPGLPLQAKPQDEEQP